LNVSTLARLNSPERSILLQLKGQIMEEALLAIIALVNGEFDNPYLLGFGPLSVDFREQVKFIAEQGLKGEALVIDAKR